MSWLQNQKSIMDTSGMEMTLSSKVQELFDLVNFASLAISNIQPVDLATVVRLCTYCS